MEGEILRTIGSCMLLGLLLLPISCSEFSDYDGQYSGRAVIAEELRAGFEAGTTASLEISFDDETHASGSLSTSDGIFEKAELIRSPHLQADPLGRLTFPGAGFLTYIFFARTSDQTPDRFKDREALVVVTLYEDGGLVLRVLMGSEDLFGIFYMDRG